MKRLHQLALVGLGLLAAPLAALGQIEIQDNTALEKSFAHGYNLSNAEIPYGVAMDNTGKFYLANGSQISVYDTSGSNILTWTYGGVQGLALHPSSNLLVTCSTTAHQVRIYDTAGNQVRQWGSDGNGPGQFNNPYSVAIGPDELVYVADTGNNRVQVFDLQGNFIRQWGSLGTSGGQFNSPRGIAVGPDDTVYVADYSNYRVQFFSKQGVFLRQYKDSSSSWRPKQVHINPDNSYLLVCSATSFRSLSLDGQVLSNLGVEISRLAGFSTDGLKYFGLTQSSIVRFARCYRTIPPLAALVPPLPQILRVAQRPGTGLVDIDFSVFDRDSPTLRVGAVAFLDGRRDLAAVIPVRTYTNTSDVQLPSVVSANTKYRATWEAGTDWPTNYGNMKVSLLAKDERGLLDFHFLTIPTINPYTNDLVISRFPYTETDLLDLWTWLVATGHSGINVQTGTVTAVTSDYGVANGTVLAQTAGTTTTTTPSGRTFLWSMISSNLASTTYSNMVIREAASNDVYRAKMGTTGRVNQWTPRIQVNGVPRKINEFGFDTGLFDTNNPAANPANAWWVVMEPR